MKKLISVFFMSAMIAGLSACTTSSADQPVGDTLSTPGTPVAANSNPAPAGSHSSAPVAIPAAPPAAPAKPEPAPIKWVSVPAGTALEVSLSEALGSKTSKPGDTFTASLASPLVIGGATVLKKGDTVHGKVVDAKESGRVKGLANMTLTLTSVVQDGKTTPIVTKALFEEAKGTKKRDAAIVGGAAGIGAAIGGIAGGGKGAATGAAIGGGAGAGTVLATKGKEVELEPEALLTFTVDKSFEVAETR